MRTPSLAAALTFAATALAGPLTPPPGPPAPTSKTLNQVEPSTPVDTLPGNANALHIISEPGAYHLTGNIEAANLARIIEITSTGVTLDLRGFRVRGDSTVDAIIESNNIGITIRNGTISGGDEFGLRLAGFGHIVEDISFSGAGAFFNQDGISLAIGFGSRVSGCVFTGAGRVSTGNAVLIENCTFSDARDAIIAGNGCVLRDVAIDANLTSGPEPIIQAANGCTLERVTITDSFRNGIVAGTSTSIISCVLQNVGSAGTQDHAISVGQYSVLTNTRVRNFGVDGIVVGSESVVAQCTIAALAGRAIEAQGGAVVDGCAVATCGTGLIGSDLTVVDSTFGLCGTAIDAGDESLIDGCRITNAITQGVLTNFACRVSNTVFRGGSSDLLVQSGDCVIEHNLLDSQSVTVQTADNVIEGNTFTDPGSGALTVNSGGNLIIRNRFSNAGAGVANIAAGNTTAAFTTNPTTAGPYDNLQY